VARRTLYHGTSSVYWPEVQRRGIVPGEGRDGEVWLASSKQEALNWAQMRVENLKWRGLPSGTRLLLEVAVDPARLRETGPGDWIHEGTIPAVDVHRIAIPRSGLGTLFGRR